MIEECLKQIIVSIRFEVSTRHYTWHKRYDIPAFLNVFHWVYMIQCELQKQFRHLVYVNYDLCDFFIR